MITIDQCGDCLGLIQRIGQAKGGLDQRVLLRSFESPQFGTQPGERMGLTVLVGQTSGRTVPLLPKPRILLAPLIGCLTALWLAPDEYSELEPFEKYFSDRIAKVTMPGSGLEHQKTAEIPAELAGKAMPDAAGALAGDQ